MNHNQHRRIEELLRADAPPARDPVFRLKVLERREQREFQRRSITVLAGILVILIVAVFASAEGQALEIPTVLVIGTVLVSVSLAFRHGLGRTLRRFTI